MGVNTNSLIKSRSGRVWHYGYFNRGSMKWNPLCGQISVGCNPFKGNYSMEGHEITICKTCLEHQIHHTMFENSGLEKQVGRIFKITDAEEFKKSMFTVGEEFRKWKKASEEDRIA